ncbi:MAG: DHHA1 domain-containing protein [Patescibacteria group bacterium]
MIRFQEKRRTPRKPTKDIVVLYHNDCTDGFGAAWAAWKKFGSKADYIGIEPGTKPIDGLKNKEVYMVDLIYPSQYLGKLIKDNKKVIAIDHHVSNQEAFSLVSDGIFDLDYSGAVLSWNYFHPGKTVPKFFKYIEDMDLWRFKLTKTKEFISYIDMINFDFLEWDKIYKGTETASKLKEYIKIGSLLLKYQDKIIERIISNHAQLVNFCGHKVYAVNSPVFNSQIGNELCKKLPPVGIVWVQYGGGGVGVSLRSDGTVDVSKLAARFGGGGHKKAAGFHLKDCNNLPWKPNI